MISYFGKWNSINTIIFILIGILNNGLQWIFCWAKHITKWSMNISWQWMVKKEMTISSFKSSVAAILFPLKMFNMNGRHGSVTFSLPTWDVHLYDSFDLVRFIRMIHLIWWGSFVWLIRFGEVHSYDSFDLVRLRAIVAQFTSQVNFFPFYFNIFFCVLLDVGRNMFINDSMYNLSPLCDEHVPLHRCTCNTRCTTNRGVVKLASFRAVTQYCCITCSNVEKIVVHLFCCHTQYTLLYENKVVCPRNWLRSRFMLNS